MIFGEKFYPMLKKMPPWRHSLFALVLATRSYSNFALWCEIKQVQGKTEFLNALKRCWSFHYDKFNHIDLEEAFDQVEPYLPLELEDYTEGDSFAFDVAVMLDVALSAVPMSSKNAQDASQASMASVIRLCENNFPEQDLDEDALLEMADIQNELQYQVDLMYKVMEPRSEENIKSLLKFALESGVSNIGLENELSEDDFSSCFIIEGKDCSKAKAQQEIVSKKDAIDEALINFDAFDLEDDLNLGQLNIEPEQNHNIYGAVNTNRHHKNRNKRGARSLNASASHKRKDNK